MKQPRTALLVDDEDPLLRLMVRVFEAAGYTTWLALDGIEALRVFREHMNEIDLVLLDVIHPPAGGASALLPQLLADRPDLEVILTSGDQLPDDLARLLVSRGGRFLRKPFAPKTLARMIENDRASDRSFERDAPAHRPGGGV